MTRHTKTAIPRWQELFEHLSPADKERLTHGTALHMVQPNATALGHGVEAATHKLRNVVHKTREGMRRGADALPGSFYRNIEHQMHNDPHTTVHPDAQVGMSRASFLTRPVSNPPNADRRTWTLDKNNAGVEVSPDIHVGAMLGREKMPIEDVASVWKHEKAEKSRPEITQKLYTSVSRHSNVGPLLAEQIGKKNFVDALRSFEPNLKPLFQQHGLRSPSDQYHAAESMNPSRFRRLNDRAEKAYNAVDLSPMGSSSQAFFKHHNLDPTKYDPASYAGLHHLSLGDPSEYRRLEFLRRRGSHPSTHPLVPKKEPVQQRFGADGFGTGEFPAFKEADISVRQKGVNTMKKNASVLDKVTDVMDTTMGAMAKLIDGKAIKPTNVRERSEVFLFDRKGNVIAGKKQMSGVGTTIVFPGGGTDNQDPRKAAEREVEEELGIRAVVRSFGLNPQTVMWDAKAKKLLDSKSPGKHGDGATTHFFVGDVKNRNSKLYNIEGDGMKPHTFSTEEVRDFLKKRVNDKTNPWIASDKKRLYAFEEAIKDIQLGRKESPWVDVTPEKKKP